MLKFFVKRNKGWKTMTAEEIASWLMEPEQQVMNAQTSDSPVGAGFVSIPSQISASEVVDGFAQLGWVPRVDGAGWVTAAA